MTGDTQLTGCTGGTAWAKLRRDPVAIAGGALTALVVALAVAAPLLFPSNPLDLAARPLTPPFASWAVPLGTDRLGRDLLAGVVHGARTSLAIGVLASLLAVAIGVLVGALAGFYRGWVDELLMRVVETFQTVPGFVLALALVAVLGPSSTSSIVAVAVISWTQTARVVRAEFLALRERDFVRACVALGAGPAAIMVRHILPNALPPVIALATMTIAVAILVESALAFLGFGDPNVASWGAMIAGGRALLRTAWYVSAVPGIAIAVTVLGVTLLGEGLTAALNPRQVTTI
jgi:peptide/nickel transport system permease protein